MCMIMPMLKNKVLWLWGKVPLPTPPELNWLLLNHFAAMPQM